MKSNDKLNRSTGGKRTARFFSVLVVSLFAIHPLRSDTLNLPRGGTNRLGEKFAGLFRGDVQQVYASSEFSGLPANAVWITGIALRPEEQRDLNTVARKIVIKMAVFPGRMEDVPHRTYLHPAKTVFEAVDYPIVAPAATLPSHFPVHFTFQQPFLYDPRAGQLVLQFPVTAGQTTPIDFDAYGVLAETGLYTFYNSGEIVTGGTMIATQLSYIVADISITSISFSEEQIHIDFRFPIEPQSVRIVSAPMVLSDYTLETEVLFTPLSDNFRRATMLRPKSNRFFKVEATYNR